MRVLDKSNIVLGFEDLGFDDDLLEIYKGIYTKPYGTILVTGPTGSGKTTTLYATLAALNAPEKNIITVEDPVELRLKGINQVQLNIKAGLNFAAASSRSCGRTPTSSSWARSGTRRRPR